MIIGNYRILGAENGENEDTFVLVQVILVEFVSEVLRQFTVKADCFV